MKNGHCFLQFPKRANYRQTLSTETEPGKMNKTLYAEIVLTNKKIFKRLVDKEDQKKKRRRREKNNATQNYAFQR